MRSPVPLHELLREEHIHLVQRAMVRRLHDRTLAEDATMELFGRVVASWHRFDATRSFETWIMGFVDNVSHEVRRREQRRLRIVATVTESLRRRGGHDHDDGGRSMPLSDEWRAAIERLRPRDRALIVLRAVEGWPAAAVGHRLGMSVSGVNTAYNRARARLEKSLALPDVA